MADESHINGITQLAIAQYAQTLGVKGIGLYVYAGGNFVHLDTRTTKYYWKQMSKMAHYFTATSF